MHLRIVDIDSAATICCGSVNVLGKPRVGEHLTRVAGMPPSGRNLDGHVTRPTDSSHGFVTPDQHMSMDGAPTRPRSPARTRAVLASV